MASLTEISVIARKIIRYGIYIIIILIIGRFAFDFGISTYKKLNPPPSPKPTVAFGKLPKIPFPPREKLEISYKLETIDGQLPTVQDQLEIYPIISYPPSIKAVENAKSKAKNLGFPDNGEPIINNVPNVYIFKKTDEPMTLLYNIITKVYSISYDLSSNMSILYEIPPAGETAISQVKSFFSKGDGLPSDLTGETAKVELLKIESGKFVKALSLSETQITKVNLFRNNLGTNKNIPVVTPNYPEANIWAMIAGGGKIFAAEYHYFPINTEIKSTYPLKTSHEAWDELNQGKAFVVRDTGQRNVTIRKVYLAYYDPDLYSEYLQPVFVFEGDEDFYAFVPAVQNYLYGKEKSEEQNDN